MPVDEYRDVALLEYILYVSSDFINVVNVAAKLCAALQLSQGSSEDRSLQVVHGRVHVTLGGKGANRMRLNIKLSADFVTWRPRHDSQVVSPCI